MNNPDYRKAYMASLNQQIKNNQTNAKANAGNPSLSQYTANTGSSYPYIGNIPRPKK
jgi:hypothetical protein